MNTPNSSSSFWQAWQDHRAYLYKQSLRLMGGVPADAEDALSTAMLRALSRFPAHTTELINQRAWLSRLLHNVCMDIHRERRRFVHEDEETGPWEPNPAQQPNSLEEELLWGERVEELLSGIQALPPNLRTPFEMRFHLGMSYPDIATSLRLTACNVRKRIHLAYGILRTTLTDPTPSHRTERLGLQHERTHPCLKTR